jgi:hypothetical protein
LCERITEPEGCRLVAEFFSDFLGDSVNGPLRVVKAPGHAFADARRKPNATTDKYVSLINRASIVALEAAMGVPVDPIRFRANVYFDGGSAWSEHDWIDSEITLGAARLRVVSPITRCAATQVNSVTAKRDLDIVAAPRPRLRPHQYGRLRRGGRRRRGRRWRRADRATGQLDRWLTQGIGVVIANLPPFRLGSPAAPALRACPKSLGNLAGDQGRR